MITVKLQGGLGNQMFQYAAAKSLAKATGQAFQLDLTFLLNRLPRKDFVFRNYDLDIFNITPQLSCLSRLSQLESNLPFIGQRLIVEFKKRLKLKSYFREKTDYCFDQDFFSLADDVYLDGYFQSYKYLEGIKEELIYDFSFKNQLSSATAELANEIKSCESVCLNVRRADYVASPLNSSFFGVMPIAYFSEAIEVIKTKLKQPKLFIFSDDIKWCQENLKLPAEYIFVGSEYAGEKFGDYLHLMTLCKHFIIPNSTFAWWGAWLSRNPDKVVVAPKKWVRDEKLNANTEDLIPGNWIRI